MVTLKLLKYGLSVLGMRKAFCLQKPLGVATMDQLECDQRQSNSSFKVQNLAQRWGNEEMKVKGKGVLLTESSKVLQIAVDFGLHLAK